MDDSAFQLLKSDRHRTACFICSADEKSKKHSSENEVSEHLMFEVTAVEGICLYANTSQWLGLAERTRGICIFDLGKV